jgi:hypothetical protein
LLAFLFSCSTEVTPLPSAEAALKVQEADAAAANSFDRSTLPPLYRQLYDYAFLPEVQAKEQRVRLLIWLKYMEFSRYQLGLLADLWERTQRERKEVEEKQKAIVKAYEPEVGKVYDRLWSSLQGEPTEEELALAAKELEIIHSREAELLELRARSVRSLIEAQSAFLKVLSPQQEIRFQDAVFLLRHRLDPYANPGDFNALIGSIYVAGDFGTLSRPTYNPEEDHLNIGGLWSEEPEKLTGPYFPVARREAILYMLLLEPTLQEAINTAESLKNLPSAPVPGQPPEPGTPSEPVPGSGAPPAPGTPLQPVPGQPLEPTPGQPAGSP